MRFSLTVAALLAGAGIAAAEPPKPAVVFQAKPLSRLLAEYKEMIRQVGGPGEGDRLVRGFEKDLKDSLGEQGFEGLDINRPLAGYAVLKDKPEDCGLVLVAPATGEKEFVAFLSRIKIAAVAVKDKPGLYALELGDGAFPKGSHLRVTDTGWAYLTLNDGDPTDAKDLVPIADLFADVDQSLASAQLFPGRVPAKLVAGLLDELDQTAGQLKMFVGAGIDEKHWAKFATTFLEQGPKLLRRYVETGLKEAEEVGAKFSFDRATGDTLTELTLTPKAGTALAKEVAGRAKLSNRFAGVVGKDAAFGVVVKAPLFAKEVREIGTVLVEAVTTEVKNLEIPEKLKAVADEAGKAIGRAVGAGAADAAVALNGPDANGKFSLVIGLSLDDPAGVEKAVRAAAKEFDLMKEFELDAAKVGDVSVHKVPLARLIPQDGVGEFEKIFGEKPPGYVAFAKDAVFVGFGSGALDGVKAALEAKPGPAPVLEFTGNAKRLQKLAAAADPRAGEELAKVLGVEDKTVSLLRVTVEGGEKLTAKATLNVRFMPKLVMGGGAAEVPPPPGR